jgi:hypothetical protein
VKFSADNEVDSALITAVSMRCLCSTAVQENRPNDNTGARTWQEAHPHNRNSAQPARNAPGMLYAKQYHD